MIVLTRASIFMGGGLASLTLLQILGLDLSSIAEPGRLKSPLVMFIALMFSIGITAVLGAAVGFGLLPGNRVITSSRLLLLGFLFGLLAFAAFIPSLQMLGIVAGGMLYVLLAAVTAFVGGRVLSRIAPPPPR